MRRKKIVVNNSMQKGYVYYRTMAPGDLSDHPEFKPKFSPEQMLQMGVFEGRYLDPKSKEFPKHWRPYMYDHSNVDYNYFGVKSRIPLPAWREKGWINDQDPRGWFEWFTRFYMGRRSDDDVRQIARWKSFGPRHTGAILKHCPAHGKKSSPNMQIRRRQRQALLQWSWNPFV